MTNWYLTAKFKNVKISPSGKIKVYLKEWISLDDIIALLNMKKYYAINDIREYLSQFTTDDLCEIHDTNCIHINQAKEFIETFIPKAKDSNLYMKRYKELYEYIENTIYNNQNKILVMFEGSVDGGKTYNLLGKRFENSEQVALWLKTSEYYVQKVLDGKYIDDNLWKPNIFFKRVDENTQKIYIVVYEDDWNNYSIKKRQNRIRKILSEELIDF